MKEWASEPFDPKAVDVEMLADDVAALAKARTRKPPAKHKQPTRSAAFAGWIRSPDTARHLNAGEPF